MKRFAPLVTLWACLPLLVCLLLPTPAVAAGATTGIIRAHSNLAVYSYTPTETGRLDIIIGWSYPDGTGAPVFPLAEVDVCVQGYDGFEPYADLDVAELYSGWNPEAGTVYVTAGNVGRPHFFTVSPFVGEAGYHLMVDFTHTPGSPTRVVDATGYAHPTNGDVYLPATATSWKSVIQQWPGTLDRSLGLSDVYASWQDYGYVPGGDFSNNPWWPGMWIDTEIWTPPVVTEFYAPAYPGLPGSWLTLTPYIWNGAARPNVWDDIATDIYAKPGSLSVAAAPAWYTWAYNDTAATTSAPAYTFGARITPAASGQSLSFQKEPGATVTYTFVGDTLSWLYAAGPAGGTATLSVEPPAGSDVPTKMWTVDQYAAAMEYGKRLDLSGLGAGLHTVVVESDAGLYHDAFLAPTDAGDLTPLAEDHSDGTTRYAWATAVGIRTSGDTYSYSGVVDSATAFTFTGTEVTWQYARRADGGIARVWIDGVAKGTVDQLGRRPIAGKAVPASITYDGLANTMHTILIVNSGTKNRRSLGTVVTSDAFTVGGIVSEN